MPLSYTMYSINLPKKCGHLSGVKKLTGNSILSWKETVSGLPGLIIGLCACLGGCGGIKDERRIGTMRDCKCCKVPVNADVEFCPFCGYDPKTDAMSASFRQNPELSEEGARRMQANRRRGSDALRPGVKMFALFSLAVVIFGVMSKNKQFWNNVISEFKQSGDKAGIKAGNIIPVNITPMGVEKKKESGGATEEYEIFNPSTPLILQGVTWGGVMPEAVINSKVYHVGDIIEGAKIIKISKQGVVVLYNSLSYLLPSFVSKYKKDQPSK